MLLGCATHHAAGQAGAGVAGRLGLVVVLAGMKDDRLAGPAVSGFVYRLFGDFNDTGGQIR